MCRAGRARASSWRAGARLVARKQLQIQGARACTVACTCGPHVTSSTGAQYAPASPPSSHSSSSSQPSTPSSSLSEKWSEWPSRLQGEGARGSRAGTASRRRSERGSHLAGLHPAAPRSGADHCSGPRMKAAPEEQLAGRAGPGPVPCAGTAGTTQAPQRACLSMSLPSSSAGAATPAASRPPSDTAGRPPSACSGSGARWDSAQLPPCWPPSQGPAWKE